MRSSLRITGAIVGLMAGIVMVTWTMIDAAVTGAGLLAPPQMIAEPLFGQFHPSTFNSGAFIVGLTIHLMVSIVFGIIFAAIWQEFAQGGLTALISGMIYGLLIWLVMSNVVAPMIGSDIAQVMPSWAWTVAHLMFGGVLGLWPMLRPADFLAPPKDNILGDGVEVRAGASRTRS